MAPNCGKPPSSRQQGSLPGLVKAPAPLFKKLDETVIEEEDARLMGSGSRASELGDSGAGAGAPALCCAPSDSFALDNTSNSLYSIYMQMEVGQEV